MYIDYNYGIGILPVSLFCNDKDLDIQILYDEILAQNCRDIVFYEFLDFTKLSWVIPRLMIEGYYVTIVCEDSVPILLVPTRFFTIITKVTPDIDRVIISLRENDILLARVKSIGELVRIRNIMIREDKKYKLMFDPSSLDKKEILNYKIYDIELYGGICI
uniref:Uncharacterized protein n=1 Tax=viral metagenome TaxID=1070528 RepID=A0A6H1ZAJ1_9ZZZZ